MKKRTLIDRYYWMTGADRTTAETVLQAERRRVRALVRKLGKQAEKVRQQDAYFCDGYQSACDDILAALKEGR